MGFYGYNPIAKDYSYLSRAGDDIGKIGAAVSEGYTEKSRLKELGAETKKLQEAMAARLEKAGWDPSAAEKRALESIYRPAGMSSSEAVKFIEGTLKPRAHAFVEKAEEKYKYNRGAAKLKSELGMSGYRDAGAQSLAGAKGPTLEELRSGYFGQQSKIDEAYASGNISDAHHKAFSGDVGRELEVLSAKEKAAAEREKEDRKYTHETTLKQMDVDRYHDILNAQLEANKELTASRVRLNNRLPVINPYLGLSSMSSISNNVTASLKEAKTLEQQIAAEEAKLKQGWSGTKEIFGQQVDFSNQNQLVEAWGKLAAAKKTLTQIYLNAAGTIEQFGGAGAGSYGVLHNDLSEKADSLKSLPPAEVPKPKPKDMSYNEIQRTLPHDKWKQLNAAVEAKIKNMKANGTKVNKDLREKTLEGTYQEMFGAPPTSNTPVAPDKPVGGGGRGGKKKGVDDEAFNGGGVSDDLAFALLGKMNAEATPENMDMAKEFLREHPNTLNYLRTRMDRG